MIKNSLQFYAESKSDKNALYVEILSIFRYNECMKKQAAVLVHELEPFYDAHSEILILGSFPSPKSREVGFYYGHPQNRFWKILAAVFGESTPESVEEKKLFLTRHRVALWDVIASCEIVGASDGSIRNPVANDLNRLLCRAPIRKILTTGAVAFKLYNKLCYPATERKAVPLPSPSAANCAMPLADLAERYRAAILGEANG